MYSKNDILTDPLVQQLIQRKQLRKSTIKLYVIALNKYCNLHQKTPTELRQEAYQDQITNPDKISRQINSRLSIFYNSLLESGLNKTSTKTMLQKVRAFYNEYNIDLPKNIIFKEEKTIRSEKEIVNINTIKKAVNNTPNLMYKALFLFLATSGIRSGDTRNFTINSFMTSLGYPDKPLNTLDTENIKHIIPCFEFISQKTGEHTITFITPEARDHLITYLKTRNNPGLDEPLFLNKKNKPLTESGFTSIFSHTNDRHNWGYKSGETGRKFFHAHALRAFFSTVLNNNGVPYSIYKKMMGQTLNDIDQAYITVNRESCRREYTHCINHLSINKVKIYDFHSEEYLQLKQQLKETEKSNEEFKEFILEKINLQK